MSERVLLISIVMCLSLAILIGGYSIYYTRIMSSRPELHVASSKFKRLILDKCHIVNETFYPTFWSATALLQTLTATALRNRLTNLEYTERELLECPDGGQVSLDWYKNASKREPDTRPVALLFPGLIGDSQSDYLRSIVPLIHANGYRVAAFNNRGRGGMRLKTPRLYCAANFDDIKLAIDHVREANPSSKIVSVGFSMGGMVLNRYLAELGAEANVNAAMLVSANYDLVNGTKNMESGLIDPLINRIMTKALISVLMEEREMLASANKGVDWDKLSGATSFRELDERFTCPMWNYATPDEYFVDATNNARMHKIRVPTLCLSSGDDIFAPYKYLPLDAPATNPFLAFVVTARGGHLGFMDGAKPTVPYYGDRLISEYLSAIRDEPDLVSLAERQQPQ
ncbi:Phospholipase ABHD3 [Fragariocoptes setiger]|uniref:Phospholipase ABHD3 n=1 Tax=Fragariocoptes setiger TaxID=1670756 RepID=A0ABQ7S6L2_9ACAR|nr:Phospholipase ABHD3 [Fragariocoptes setiger]